jgi:WD40 repeat protein
MTAKEDYFAGGSYEKKFRYWEAPLLTTPKTIITGQKKSAVSVAISNNNSLIAIGSLDSTIEIWETNSLSRINKILAHSAPVCCLQFINNDKQLISASHDSYLKLWDVNSGEILKIYRGHTKPISSIAVSPDEKYVLSASYDHLISLYSIKDGRRIYHYKYHESPVLDIRWNALGDGFYSCDERGHIVEWNVPNKVFVEHYFETDLNIDIINSKLFLPKQKGESKDDYKLRLKKAEDFKLELIEKYYQRYLDEY